MSDRPGTLAWVQSARSSVDDAEVELALAVHYAKSDGASWTQIADALGTSRQNAHRKYGKEGA